MGLKGKDGKEVEEREKEETYLNMITIPSRQCLPMPGNTEQMYVCCSNIHREGVFHLGWRWGEEAESHGKFSLGIPCMN